mgnify:CR=1 FL=1
MLDFLFHVKQHYQNVKSAKIISTFFLYRNPTIFDGRFNIEKNPERKYHD